MKLKNRSSILGAFFIIISVANAAIIHSWTSPTKLCVEICKEVNGMVDLGVLRSHTYQFGINHRVTTPLNKDAASLLVIKGNATIIGATDCNYRLKLENVEVYEQFKEKIKAMPIFVENLQKRILYFGYEDGEVTGFCPTVREDEFSWNIKAAILSHLQVNIKSLTYPSKLVEEDVSGLCVTEYSLIDNSNSTLRIKKSKSTAGCARKYNFKSAFDSVDQDYPSISSKSKLIDGSQNCEIELDVGGPVKSVECTENLSVKGLLDVNWSELNQVIVTTSLKLISSESGGTIENDDKDRFTRTRLSDHDKMTPSGKTAWDFSDEQLDTNRLVAELLGGKMRYFHPLVRKLQTLSVWEMQELVGNYNANSPATIFIYEAAIYAKTKSAFQFLTAAFKSDAFAVPVLKLCYLPDPSLDNIQDIQHALKEKDYKVSAIVVSTLLHKFCKTHRDCMSNPTAQYIANDLEMTLFRHGNNNSRQSVDEVIYTLIAIGNLGQVTNKKQLYKLLQQMMDPDRYVADSRLQLATAEAFRNFEVDEDVDKMLLDIFENVKGEPALRIQAYRSWIRGVDEAKVSKLNKLLENEQSDQVRSYMMSHVTSLWKSRDPFKQNIRKLIHAFLNPKWQNDENPKDFRKYSNYFERSFSTGKIGGNVEASVIYGKSSPFPRSLSINVILEAAGRSYNLFELGYRSLTSPRLYSWLIGPLEEKQYPSNSIGNEFDPFFRKEAETTTLFARMFGHDLIHTLNAEAEYASLGQIFNPTAATISMEEVTSLPTMGGLMLETGFYVVSSQNASFSRGTKFIDFQVHGKLSAEGQTLVILNTPSGAFGFKTEDTLQTKVDLAFSSDESPFRNDFTLLLRGMKPNVSLFKYSRDVKRIAAGEQLERVMPDGEPVDADWTTPRVTDNLVGLVAQASQRCYAGAEKLCTQVSLVAKRFDGILLKRDNPRPTCNRFTLSRPRGELGLLTIDPLIQLTIEKTIERTQQLFNVNLVTAWNKTYSLQAYITKNQEFLASIQLGAWRSNASGTITRNSFQGQISIGGGNSLKIDYEYGHRPSSYQLDVLGAGSIMPFSLKSIQIGNVFQQFYHTTSLTSQITGNVTLDFGFESQGPFFSGNATLSREKNGKKTQIFTDYVYNLRRNRTLRWQSTFSRTNETDITMNIGHEYTKSSTKTAINYEGRYWLQLPFEEAFNGEVFFRHNIDFHNGASMRNETFEAIAKIPGQDVNARLQYNLNLFGNGIIQNLHLNSSIETPSYAPNLNLEFLYDTTSAKIWVLANLENNSTHRYYLLNNIDLRKQQYKLQIDYPPNQSIFIETPFKFDFDSHNFNLSFDPDVYLNSEKLLLLKTDAKLNIAQMTFMLEQNVYTTDGNSTNLTSKLNANFSMNDYVNANVKLDLPTVNKGTIFDAAILMNRQFHNFSLKSHAILEGTRKSGFELTQIFKMLNIIQLIETRISLYGCSGIQFIKPDIFNYKYTTTEDYSSRSRCSIDRADGSVYLIKQMLHMKSPSQFEGSCMYSITPGSPSPNFTGFFFKTATSFNFKETEFKYSQNGEWNAKQGHGPGMPFRYGVEYTHEPDYRQGQISAFAEDTNLGKLIDFELFEVKYDYKLEDSYKGDSNDDVDDDDDDPKKNKQKKDDDMVKNIYYFGNFNRKNEPDKNKNSSTHQFLLESICMVNWRRFLGRGVVGTQGTLNANMSDDFSACRIEVTGDLTDDNQSKAVLLIDYLRDKDSQYNLKTKSTIENELVYEVEVNIKAKHGQWDLAVAGNSPALNMSGGFETVFKQSNANKTLSCQARLSLKKEYFLNQSISFTGLQARDKKDLELRWNSNIPVISNGLVSSNYFMSVANKTSILRLEYDNQVIFYLDIGMRNYKHLFNFEMGSENVVLPIDLLMALNISESVNGWHGLAVRLNLPNKNFSVNISDWRWYIQQNGLKCSGQFILKTAIIEWTDVNINSSVCIIPIRKSPSIDFSTVILRENNLFFRGILLVSKENLPKLDVYANYTKPFFGLNELDLFFIAPIKTDKFTIESHFRTQPVIANFEMKSILEESIFSHNFTKIKRMSLSRHKQLFDVSINVTDSNQTQHEVGLLWNFYRKTRRSPYSFQLNAKIDSTYLATGKINVSTDQVFGFYPYIRGTLTSGEDISLIYSLKCSSNSIEPDCSMMVKNTNPFEQSFNETKLQFRSINKERYTLSLKVDDKHSLEVVLSPANISDVGITSKMKINNQLVFNSTIVSRFVSHIYGFSFNLNSTHRVFALDDQSYQDFLFNIQIEKKQFSSFANAELSFSSPTDNLTTRKANVQWIADKVMLNVDLEPLTSTVFAYSLKNQDFQLTSHLDDVYNVDFRSNLLYLVYAMYSRLTPRKTTLIPPLIPPSKSYSIASFDNLLMLEFDRVFSINFVCNIIDIKEPIVFRTGYVWVNDQLDTRLRLDFEMDEPCDAKLVLDGSVTRHRHGNLDHLQLIAGIAKDLVIPKSMANFSLQIPYSDQPLDISLYIKSIRTLDTNINIDVQRDFINSTLRFLWPTGEVDSFNLTSTFPRTLVPNIPVEIIYISKHRKARLGYLQTDHSHTLEVSWNQLKQGTLLLIVNKTIWGHEILIDTPVRNITFRFENRPFWNLFLQSQGKGGKSASKTTFMEVKVNAYFQIQLISTFLKEPISTYLSDTPNVMLWTIHRGTFKSPTSTVFKLNTTRDISQFPRVYSYLTMSRGDKTLSLNSLLNLDFFYSQIDTNFSIDDRQGSFKFRHIPFERFYFNLNNQSVVDVTSSFHEQVITTDFSVTYKEDELRFNGNLYFNRDPMDVYLRLNTLNGEGFAQLNVDDLFNITGVISHSFKDTDDILDAKFISLLNRSNIYSLQTFWREGAFADLLINGLNSMTKNGFLQIWMQLEDAVFTILEDYIGTLRELVDEEAVYSFSASASEDLEEAIKSLTTWKDSGLTFFKKGENAVWKTLKDFINFQNSTINDFLSQNAKSIYSAAIHSIDTLSNLTMKIKTFSIDWTRFNQVLENIERLCKSSFCQLKIYTSACSDSIFDFYQRVKVALEPFHSEIVFQYNQWNELVSSLKPIWERMSSLEPDLAESLHVPMEVMESTFKTLQELVNGVSSTAAALASSAVKAGWLTEWLNANFTEHLQNYFQPDVASFTANWMNSDVNVTVFLPTPFQKLTTIALASTVGVPLRNTGLIEQCLMILPSWNLKPYLTKKGWNQIWQNLKYNMHSDAFLFLKVLGQSHVITFDGAVSRFTPIQDQRYLLTRDFVNQQFVLVVHYASDEVHFELNIQGNNLTISECGSYLFNNKERKMTEMISMGSAVVRLTIHSGSWQIYVHRKFKITYVNKWRLLRLQTSASWHGRLIGLLGDNDNDKLKSENGKMPYIYHHVPDEEKNVTWSLSPRYHRVWSVPEVQPVLANINDVEKEFSYFQKIKSDINLEHLYNLLRSVRMNHNDNTVIPRDLACHVLSAGYFLVDESFVNLKLCDVKWNSMFDYHNHVSKIVTPKPQNQWQSYYYDVYGNLRYEHVLWRNGLNLN